MITLRNKKTSQPALERLDLRITPTTMSRTAALFAELKVETRQVHRLEVSLTTARPGSGHEIILSERITAKEGLIGRQEVRLANIEARATGSQNSLPENVSQTLDVIFDAYETNPSGFPANVSSTDNANMVVIQGSSVGIQVHDGDAAEFNSLLTELQSAGMQVTISSAQSGTIVGMLPISQLPAVAALPQTPGIMPEFIPSLK
jgi:hypothetical protein